MFIIFVVFQTKSEFIFTNPRLAILELCIQTDRQTVRHGVVFLLLFFAKTSPPPKELRVINCITRILQSNHGYRVIFAQGEAAGVSALCEGPRIGTCCTFFPLLPLCTLRGVVVLMHRGNITVTLVTYMCHSS